MVAIKRAPDKQSKLLEDAEQATPKDLGDQLRDAKSLKIKSDLATICEAILGHIKILLVNDGVVEMSAATLNAASVGGVIQRSAVCLMHDVDSRKHTWVNGNYTANVSVVDTLTGGQPASAVPASTDWENGTAVAPLTVGTGSGAWPSGAAGAGSWVCGTGAQLSDGETLTIVGNGLVGGYSQTFEYRSDGGAPSTLGNRVIPYGAGDSAAQIAQKTMDVVNACRPRLRVLATISTNTVTLTQELVGADGNTTLSDTVTDAAFVPTNFTGGSGDKIEVTFSVESSAGAGDDKLPFGVTVVPLTQRFVCR